MAREFHVNYQKEVTRKFQTEWLQENMITSPRACIDTCWQKERIKHRISFEHFIFIWQAYRDKYGVQGYTSAVYNQVLLQAK